MECSGLHRDTITRVNFGTERKFFILLFLLNQ